MKGIESKILKLFHEDGKREQAFRLLVDSYSERLYLCIRRIVHEHETADDLLQDTFIKIWRALPEFRAESKLYTWMYRIAVNEALQHLRSQKRQPDFLADTDTALTEQLLADPYFDGDEAELKLQEAILRLPEKQKTVFLLKYYDGLTYEQMSESLNTSVGALKASYHHAVKKIEVFLKRD